jgi:DNA-binding beta-propeller fold protein YncE
VGAFPHDATQASGRVFVADERGNTVTVVDGRRALRTLPAPVQPGGIAAGANGRRVAVVAVRERVVRAIDALGYRSLGQAPAGGGPTHIVSDGRNRIYVADTHGGALLLLHFKPRLEIVRRVALPGAPYGLAIDRERARLWVTLTARNRLVELTANGQPRPLRSFPTVAQPNAVAVDERSGRVFVAGKRAGVIQMLDP